MSFVLDLIDERRADRDEARMRELDELIRAGWGDTDGAHIPRDWRTRRGPKQEHWGRCTLVWRTVTCSDCGKRFDTSGTRTVRCVACQARVRREADILRKRQQRAA